MKQGRGSWYLLTGLMMGLVVGLGYSWFLDPIEYSNASPQSLKSEYKDDYRSMIALSYQVNGDLGRTLGRLALLKDEDMSEALNVQAQRILARSGNEKQARALAELAVVLKGKSLTALSTQIASNNALAAGLSTEQEPATPSGTDIPDEDTDLVETKTPSATPQPTFTPRPSASPLPGVDVPFVFVSAEEICDPELPEGLFQVYILNRSGEGMAGVRVHVTWDGGEEYFYTGLYPQFSLGYADYQASEGVAYLLRAGESGETVRDLAPPVCGEEDEAYTGGLLLRFTEP